MAILKGPVNPVTTGITTFPDLKSVQVTAPNRHSIRPSLVLDFINSKTLDPRITFTRGSNATFYDGSSAIAEQNLLVRSQDWSTIWGLNSSATTVTANSTTAPDGTLTATQFSIARTNSELHYSEQSFTLGGNVTVSAYFKANTWNFLNLAVYQAGFTDAYSVAFNLSTGAITKTTSAGSVGNVSSSITSVGNSWYRVTVTAQFPSTAATYLIFSTNSISVPTYNYQGILESYAGTVGNSFYVWGAQMEQRSNASAYTPTTTTPIISYMSVLATAGPNQPRFEVDPVTEDNKGLLIESARTNLFTYSTLLTNAAWLPNNATNVLSDPNIGSYLVVPSTGNTTHQWYNQAGVAVTAQAYTFSLNVKPYGYTKVRLADVSTGNGCWFDVSTGTVGSATAGFVGSISPIGNGYYRCSMTFTASAGNQNYGIYIGNTTESTSFAGNGFSGLLVSSPQLEVGSFATSYIPTVAATATRAADVAVMTGGTNFSGWFNQVEGTMYADVSSPFTPTTPGFAGILAITDSGASNVTISMGVNGSTGLLQHEQYTYNNSRVFNTYSPTNRIFKTAFVYDNTGGAGLLAGGTVTTATTSYPNPIVDRLRIGTERTGGAMFNGNIKKIAYYPKRLPSAELISLTTA